MNALTIDVEDYFHVSAFERYVKRSDWDRYPLRVVENTQRVLDLLDDYDIKATFFVLGWVAERCPALIRQIRRRGHELACHGYAHELIYQIGPGRFREDIRRCKTLLEEVSGDEVVGYRAPSYSITNRSLWALEILVEEGFCYDSSIFPIFHDTYGIPDAQRFPHCIKTGSGPLLEFPLTTQELAFGLKKVRVPIAGGGYLRLLPVELIRMGMQLINDKQEQPVVLYFHPWEVDPDQPRIEAGWLSSFRHYQNLGRTEAKLKHLLDRLSFCTMRNVLTPLFPPPGG